MKLLCVGDVAISAELVTEDIKLPPGLIIPGENERILLNWEFPIGTNLNKMPRPSGPRIMVAPNVSKKIEKWAPGFVSLATNHMLDAGFNGIVETKNELKKIGFKTVGAGLSSGEITRTLIWETEEGKVAIINWVFPETNPDRESVYGINCWPGLDIAKEIIKDKKKEADWLNLSLHWSDELFPFPRPEDRELAKELSNCGVDFIVGHHPHIGRGFEEINNCLVFYSLGNFFFSDFKISNNDWIKQAPMNKLSFAVLITFKKHQSPTFKWILFEQKNNDLIIKPINELQKRIRYLNQPFIKLKDKDYFEWYQRRKKIFFKFDRIWEYGIKKLGIIGSISYLFNKLLQVSTRIISPFFVFYQFFKIYNL